MKRYLAASFLLFAFLPGIAPLYASSGSLAEADSFLVNVVAFGHFNFLASASLRPAVVKKKKRVRKKSIKKKSSTVKNLELQAKNVFVNGAALTPALAEELKSTYGGNFVPGKYWYDGKSGAFGREGEGMINFINPNHALGAVARSASNGNTGVFINGRELPESEVLFYAALLGGVLPGKYWLEGATGNFGVENSDVPLGNLLLVIQNALTKAASNFPGGGGSFSRSGTTDATTGSQGGCSYVSFGDGSGASVGC